VELSLQRDRWRLDLAGAGIALAAMPGATDATPVPLGSEGLRSDGSDIVMFDRIKDLASDLLGGQEPEDLVTDYVQGDQATDMAANFGQYTELFQGLDFPVSQDELIAQLQERGADSGVINQIMETHQGSFNGVDDVLNAIRNR
jgi:hypothetical protein